MRYEAIPPITRRDAEAAFASGDQHAVVYALIGSALHGDDWRWVQERCVDLCTSNDVWIQRACATSILHVARIQRDLDVDQALVVFRTLLGNPEIAGEIPEMLDEIRVSLRRRAAGRALADRLKEL